VSFTKGSMLARFLLPAPSSGMTTPMETTFTNLSLAVKAQLSRKANIRPMRQIACRGLYRRGPAPKLWSMEELLRSNDPVYLSFVRHVLDEEGIHHLVLDEHMSVLEGSIGILPRRILVAADDLEAARRALGNAALTSPE
jgi:hypothetical protein